MGVWVLGIDVRVFERGAYLVEIDVRVFGIDVWVFGMGAWVDEIDA